MIKIYDLYANHHLLTWLTEIEGSVVFEKCKLITNLDVNKHVLQHFKIRLHYTAT